MLDPHQSKVPWSLETKENKSQPTTLNSLLRAKVNFCIWDYLPKYLTSTNITVILHSIFIMMEIAASMEIMSSSLWLSLLLMLIALKLDCLLTCSKELCKFSLMILIKVKLLIPMLISRKMSSMLHLPHTMNSKELSPWCHKKLPIWFNKSHRSRHNHM